MPLYGLGYSVRMYQFSPDVTLNSSEIQAEGGMGRGGVAAAAGKSALIYLKGHSELPS